MLTAKEVAKDIWWVGAIDWNERLFHGYTTEKGITYNAYLIMDEKVTLIDTAKAPFADELMARIAQVVDPAKIDIVISNHVEMDHSGSLPVVAKACPNATFYASPKGCEGLKAHYGDIADFKPLKTGDTLSIGARTLTFVETPMVHWPDNMVTYDATDQILFSNDAFGQHFASSKHFDVDNDMCEVMKQARKYYANIVLPYSPQAAKAAAVVKTLDLKMICPAHGVIWTEHIPDIVEAYDYFTSGTVVDKAAVIYDSMWKSTEKMAKAICEAFVEENVTAQYINLNDTHESDIMAYLMDAKYVCVGSPTLNMQMMPNVAKFLTYYRGLSPKPLNAKRVGVAFGSFGWAPKGPNDVAAVLAETGHQMPVATLTHQWIPGKDYLDSIQETVREAIAKSL